MILKIPPTEKEGGKSVKKEGKMEASHFILYVTMQVYWVIGMLGLKTLSEFE